MTSYPAPCLPQGTIDASTGAVDMSLKADMDWSLLYGLLAGPTLPIRARLTTEEGVSGKVAIKGRRLVNGAGELVAVCEIPATSNALTNLLLWLPATAWARLPSQFMFINGRKAEE